jgi:hypothetical protein
LLNPSFSVATHFVSADTSSYKEERKVTINNCGK